MGHKTGWLHVAWPALIPLWGTRRADLTWRDQLLYHYGAQDGLTSRGVTSSYTTTGHKTGWLHVAWPALIPLWGTRRADLTWRDQLLYHYGAQDGPTSRGVMEIWYSGLMKSICDPNTYFYPLDSDFAIFLYKFVCTLTLTLTITWRNLWRTFYKEKVTHPPSYEKCTWRYNVFSEMSIVLQGFPGIYLGFERIVMRASLYFMSPTSSPMRFWHFKFVKYANTPSI
jgi:hypothetical protein